jgi:Protein of unknown function (DUF3131)
VNALARARGQIVFLAGLIAAAGIVLWLDRRECVPVSDIEPAARFLSPPPAQAREAWAYFVRNRDPNTGLVNANERSGWTTAGDAGHLLQAAVAAHRLGLIDGRELYQRLSLPLKTLSGIATRDAGMRLETGTARTIGAAGTASVEPLVSALALIAWSYPANSRVAARELDRWRAAPQPPGGPPAPPTDAARLSMLLMKIALERGGEHR